MEITKTIRYDYEEDELYEQMDDGTLILPALDANPKINIEKNEVSLLYFYSDPKDLLFEIGSECHSFKLFWEYSQRLNQDLMVLSQKINGRDIPVGNREYEWIEDIFESRNIRFEANTGQQYLIKNTTLDFVNGIYWGLIDEDQLQYYNLKKNIVNLDDVIALIPKDGRPIPKSDIQNIESGNYELKSTIIEENYVIRGISYDEETLVKVDIFDNLPAGIVNLELVHTSCKVVNKNNKFFFPSPPKIHLLIIGSTLSLISSSGKVFGILSIGYNLFFFGSIFAVKSYPGGSIPCG